MAMPNLQKIERASVQEHVNAQKNEAPADFWFEGSARTELLAPYASAQRKRDLLNYYRHPYNGMVQSAFAGMTKKWAGIDWRIKGKRNRARFERVFETADFGDGFEAFRQKVGLDFLRFDDGAYIELIFPGHPLRPPTGPLLSVAHLPNLRCVPTGDPEFPVLYVDRKAKRHLLHHTRVIHLVDAPDGDDSYPGYGLCALSRAIALAAQQIHMMRYIEAKLDDKPSPGYMVASNINAAQKHAAFERYRQEQGNDTRPEWGKTIWFYSVDPTAPASIKPVSYSEAPDAFNYKEYMEIHVNALALALGVDVQELWQLTGGTLGSGQQSMVLHAKSQNKTFAAFLDAFAPKLNDALPAYADFEFVVRDPYAIQDEAMSAQAWAGAMSVVSKHFTTDEIRGVMAAQSPAIRDQIANADGSIQPGPAQADPDAESREEPPQTDGLRTDAEGPRQMALLERRIGERKDVKADDEPPETPQQAFERAFAALLDDVAAGVLTEVMLRARLRDLLQRYGYAAYREALAAVDEARELSESDNRALLLLLAALAPFVRKFAADLFGLSGEARAIRAVALKSHAELWWNKSVREFTYEGAYRADPDQSMTFTGEDGLESCSDCQRLKGVTRPMWWWKATRQRPGVDTDAFDCGGWRCQHYLTAA